MARTDARRLDRDRDGRPAGPVRIAHLGPGNFFRAHQAWYTEHAPDGPEWGIAALAGRSGSSARALAEQDGLYTLVVRGADGDRPEVVSSLAAVSADLADWRQWFARPELAVVTLTVTEAGYRRAADGGLDRDDPAVAADIAALRADGADADVVTAPGRLAVGLAVRRNRELPDLAVVPCDNVPGNGAMAQRVVGDLTAAVDERLAAWTAGHVTFVSTMVDRITPHATDADRAALQGDTGVADPVAVVTEPFSEWVLCGRFPRGRPRWEDAGARFVDDVEPWEKRKLALLNGAHSLMAYAGSIRGHRTVYEAVSDPVVRSWVQQWWDEAARHLPLPRPELDDYCAALLTRYRNPRIRHLLGQIAADGSQKIPIRILPTVHAELANGRVPAGAARVLAAWVCHLRGLGVPVDDVAAAEFTALAGGDLGEAVGRMLTRLGVDDAAFREAVSAAAHDLSRSN